MGTVIAPPTTLGFCHMNSYAYNSWVHCSKPFLVGSCKPSSIQGVLTCSTRIISHCSSVKCSASLRKKIIGKFVCHNSSMALESYPPEGFMDSESRQPRRIALFVEPSPFARLQRSCRETKNTRTPTCLSLTYRKGSYLILGRALLL